MTTTIVTRTGKGGRLSVAEMDANFTNLQATADAAAPQATTYTKTAVDTALAAKAPLASPGFTGTVTGITASMVGLGSVTNDKQLKDSQTLTVTGDATASATSLNTGTIALTLATITDSGTGSFKKVTVNTKGLVTGTAAVAQADITGLLGAGSITNTMLANSAVANLSGTNTGDETLSTIKTKLGITTLSGSNTGDQTITLTGDATGTGTGSFAVTLANSGVTAGTYNNAATTHTPFTVDAKGRVTSTGTAVTIAPAFSSITGLPTTLAGHGITDAYTKTQTDALLQGLDPKGSVVVATTANITLSGTQTIDGIAVVAGDRVLVKNQTTTSANGIYVVAAGSWTRATDMDAWTEVPGAYIFVEKGTANSDTGWVCTSDQGGTLDTTAIAFGQFAGAGAVTAGTGIAVSGTQVALATLSDSGTGSFLKITRDTYGRVSGSAAVAQADITGLLGAGSISNAMLANAAVASLSGTNSGDETAATIKTKLGVTTLTGSNTGDQTITLTGDATGTGTGSFVVTLAASGVTAGTVNNSATAVTPITVDAKGRVTATGTAVTITPAFSSITGKPTTLAGYGITDAGYLNIPQVSNSANYTTVLTDSGKHLLHPSADTTARTFTIDSNANVAYPIGTTIAFVNQNGAGALTIAIATDTMRLAGAGTTGSRTLAANGIATAVKIASTEWIISGTNLT